jgi:hypothetical protein
VDGVALRVSCKVIVEDNACMYEVVSVVNVVQENWIYEASQGKWMSGV